MTKPTDVVEELWDILKENEVPLSDQLKRVMDEIAATRQELEDISAKADKLIDTTIAISNGFNDDKGACLDIALALTQARALKRALPKEKAND